MEDEIIENIGKEVTDKVYEYIDLCEDRFDEFEKTRGDRSSTFERLVYPKPPSVEGLALFLGVTRKTIYNRQKKYQDFADAFDFLQCKAIEMLTQGGLGGHYNSVIAKVRLAGLGIRDSIETDITTNGKDLNTTAMTAVAKKALDILNGKYDQD